MILHFEVDYTNGHFDIKYFIYVTKIFSLKVYYLEFNLEVLYRYWE